MAISYLFFKIDSYWKRKFPKSYSKQTFGLDKYTWYNSGRYISFSILFIFYLHIAANAYGIIQKKQILDKSSIGIRFSDNEIKKGKMIGKTKDVIFIMTGEKVEAIPITSLVKEIEIIK